MWQYKENLRNGSSHSETTEAKWWGKLGKEHLQQDLGVPSGWSYKQCFLCFVMYPTSQEVRGIWSHHMIKTVRSLNVSHSREWGPGVVYKDPTSPRPPLPGPNSAFIPNWAFHKAQRKEICWSPELKHSREHVGIGESTQFFQSLQQTAGHSTDAHLGSRASPEEYKDNGGLHSTRATRVSGSWGGKEWLDRGQVFLDVVCNSRCIPASQGWKLGEDNERVGTFCVSMYTC